MNGTYRNQIDPWFAVQTRSRYENLAAKQLNGRGYEVFLPFYQCRRRWSDRMQEFEVPLFPGYLFCRFNLQDRLPILTTPGVIQTIAGTGSAGFSGDGGPAISAKLNHPYGITLDLAGNVYIADLGNARVRKIDTTGSISTVAGGGLRAIPSGQAINAIDAILKSPRNVVVDILGNLYISDFTANQV